MKITYAHLLAMNENLFPVFKTYITNNPTLLKKKDHMGANLMHYASVSNSCVSLEFLKEKFRMFIREPDDK